MSQPELLLLRSEKELDRLKVLPEVQEGHWTPRPASGQLGLTDRWVRKLLERLRTEGDGGSVHRRRGRPSNRRLPTAWRERVVARRVLPFPNQLEIAKGWWVHDPPILTAPRCPGLPHQGSHLPPPPRTHTLQPHRGIRCTPTVPGLRKNLTIDLRSNYSSLLVRQACKDDMTTT
jgi:hypothetical protein